MIDAAQAERDGLVAKVVPNDKVAIVLWNVNNNESIPFWWQLLETALEMANRIASFSRPAVAMAKETVNASYELNLEEGLRFERRIFHSMFSLEDQKEGMDAFINKRPAQWTNK